MENKESLGAWATWAIRLLLVGCMGVGAWYAKRVEGSVEAVAAQMRSLSEKSDMKIQELRDWKLMSQNEIFTQSDWRREEKTLNLILSSNDSRIAKIDGQLESIQRITEQTSKSVEEIKRRP